MLNKLKYFISHFLNYKNILIPVLYYEIVYSLKYLEFGAYIKIHNSRTATYTVPCIYYFLHLISKFIKKRKINSVIDLGSGYGRVTNFLSDHTNSKIIGFELNTEVYKKSLKLKRKKIKIINKNILNINFKKNRADCFIMIDPLKKPQDTIKLQKKIIKANKFEKRIYFAMVNINRRLLIKDLKIIKTTKTGVKGSIHFLMYN